MLPGSIVLAGGCSLTAYSSGEQHVTYHTVGRTASCVPAGAAEGAADVAAARVAVHNAHLCLLDLTVGSLKGSCQSKCLPALRVGKSIQRIMARVVALHSNSRLQLEAVVKTQ